MILQDLINSQAYSIHLDDIKTNNGENLFSGIDAQKIVGSLKTLALSQGANAFQATLSWLSLDGFLPGFQESIIDESASTEMFLDTGASIIILSMQP